MNENKLPDAYLCLHVEYININAGPDKRIGKPRDSYFVFGDMSVKFGYTDGSNWYYYLNSKYEVRSQRRDQMYSGLVQAFFNKEYYSCENIVSAENFEPNDGDFKITFSSFIPQEVQTAFMQVFSEMSKPDLKQLYAISLSSD